MRIRAGIAKTFIVKTFTITRFYLYTLIIYECIKRHAFFTKRIAAVNITVINNTRGVNAFIEIVSTSFIQVLMGVAFVTCLFIGI